MGKVEIRHETDIAVIGGGQSGLALGYYLRRLDHEFLILDAGSKSGGAWNYTWDSLKLFSPAFASSLPGRIMPGGQNHYPNRGEVLDYLADYETKYTLPIKRPVKVRNVHRVGEGFDLTTSLGLVRAKAVISATGTWTSPYIPTIPGQNLYGGTQLHSAAYRRADPYQGKHVLVVGEGNSGAQICADLIGVAESVQWACLNEPTFLPPEMDGRYLFEAATRKYTGQSDRTGVNALQSVVQVAPVREALENGTLPNPMPAIKLMERQMVILEDGSTLAPEVVIWCTGFKPAIEHLAELLGPEPNPRNWDIDGTKVTEVPGLWMVGYGNWTGYASATLIGVGRTARRTAKEVDEYLGEFGQIKYNTVKGNF
ncbi:NAD(P)-binding domain-containing protein [Pontibacter sp. G13]|uniref:NAD(P)-binding domain-containing protein n=1 Tax=Pontibacter sp. G13 TaxID=3074898 RepID=UPI00288BFECF|nr:NAD(P)-binding domain-containing protein [Pontibacter sp. G13]WNJ18817.1 NAD(P)-binding domain-containing protein [Pontibacter sp. G13]